MLLFWGLWTGVLAGDWTGTICGRAVELATVEDRAFFVRAGAMTFARTEEEWKGEHSKLDNC